jgi:hypothetical protein
MRRMNWIHIISDELPRMRLYASASLGSPAEGDLAVEAALGDFFESHLGGEPDRALLFRLLDRQMRPLSELSASERVELLKHITGFCADEAHGIVQWDALAPLRSTG